MRGVIRFIFCIYGVCLDATKPNLAIGEISRWAFAHGFPRELPSNELPNVLANGGRSGYSGWQPTKENLSPSA